MNRYERAMEIKESIAQNEGLTILNYYGIYPNKKNEILCPFHNDKHLGSTIYYPQKNTIRCFSCGANKDVIDLVREKENKKFIDAIEFIWTSILGHPLKGIEEDRIRLPFKFMKEIGIQYPYGNPTNLLFSSYDKLEVDEVYQEKIQECEENKQNLYQVSCVRDDKEIKMYNFVKRENSKFSIYDELKRDTTAIKPIIVNKMIDKRDEYISIIKASMDSQSEIGRMCWSDIDTGYDYLCDLVERIKRMSKMIVAMS